MGEFESGWEVSDDLQHKDADGIKLQERNFERVHDPRKPQLFILAIQDDQLKITEILSDPNYDTLWQKGIEEAKLNGGFWSIFNNAGKFVDGNVIAR